MNAWLKETEIPKTIKTGKHETIHDTKLLIDTALETLKHSEPGTLNFRAAYYRLFRLKQHLESTEQ